MSDSQSTFLKHLGGKAIARFKLDPSGQPVFVEGEGGTKHYVFDLSLPPVTPEVSIVTYRLHPTYYDPVRESEDPVTHFQEQITSFGDYRLNIEAAVGGRLLAERVNLSERLREGRRSGPTSPGIAQAIETIEGR